MSPKRIFGRDRSGKMRDFPVEQFPLCPSCEKILSHSPIFFEAKTHTNEDGDEYHGQSVSLVYQCNIVECEQLVTVKYYLDPNSIHDEYFEIISSYPAQPLTHLTKLLERKNIPDQVRSDILECGECAKYELYQAFGAMVRRVMHSICADKGAQGNDLARQINFLLANSTFTVEVADRAHEIRSLGRNAAHPEWEPLYRNHVESGLAHIIWITQKVYPEPELPPPPDLDFRNTLRLR